LHSCRPRAAQEGPRTAKTPETRLPAIANRVEQHIDQAVRLKLIVGEISLVVGMHRQRAWFDLIIPFNPQKTEVVKQPLDGSAFVHAEAAFSFAQPRQKGVSSSRSLSSER
jgi:hypothetical protein